MTKYAYYICLICLIMRFYVFSRWQMVAILDLEVKLTSNVKNKHFILFVVFMLVEKDTSLVFGARGFVFFKMPNGGHFEFCGFTIFPRCFWEVHRSYIFSKYILVVKSIKIQRYREKWLLISQPCWPIGTFWYDGSHFLF